MHRASPKSGAPGGDIGGQLHRRDSVIARVAIGGATRPTMLPQQDWSGTWEPHPLSRCTPYVNQRRVVPLVDVVGRWLSLVSARLQSHIGPDTARGGALETLRSIRTEDENNMHPWYLMRTASEMRRNDVWPDLLAYLLWSPRWSAIGHPVSPTGGGQWQMGSLRRFVRVMFKGVTIRGCLAA